MATNKNLALIGLFLILSSVENGYGFECYDKGIKQEYESVKNIFSVKISAVSKGHVSGEVVENFKGESNKKISINPTAQFLKFNDLSMFVPGKTYIFATETYKSDGEGGAMDLNACDSIVDADGTPAILKWLRSAKIKNPIKDKKQSEK